MCVSGPRPPDGDAGKAGMALKGRESIREERRRNYSLGWDNFRSRVSGEPCL